MANVDPNSRQIAIIGAGISAICLGIRLKQAGIDSFTIYEKASSLGGTWRDNTYPGARCDIESLLYCFSFALKTDWSAKWAPQAEILAYLEDCATRYGIDKHIRFGVEIESAVFDEARGEWRLRTRDGETIEAAVLVSGVGQLSRPLIPAFAGLAEFEGESFHSAAWNHGYDLEGKAVAVIGNAASAVQLIPEIARHTKHLYVFQRSANWILPLVNRTASEADHARLRRQPWRARLQRWSAFLSNEAKWPLFLSSRTFRRQVEKDAMGHLRASVPDQGMQAALTPDYPAGAKRVLVSDDYYPALNRPNVTLVHDAIEKFTARSIVTAAGREISLDAVIFATGFDSRTFLAPIRVEGLAGKTLAEEWKDGAHAYYGMAVSGFPNFFMMYGPNSNLGHNSVIFMIECQTNYILGCIQALSKRDLKYLNLKAAVGEKFDRKTLGELSRTVWALPVRSWYKQADGRITTNWPGSSVRYWWETRRLRLSDYAQA